MTREPFSGRARAITPLASVQTTDPGGGNTKKAKLARFIRRNFKALRELGAYFENFESMLSRAALSKDVEARLHTRMKSLQAEILGVVESTADVRLRERLKSMGIADGEDLF